MLLRRRPALEVLAHLLPAPGPELVEPPEALVQVALQLFQQLVDGAAARLFSGRLVELLVEELPAGLGVRKLQLSAARQDGRAAVAYLVGRGEAYGEARGERQQEEVELARLEAALVGRAGQRLVEPARPALPVLQQLLGLVELLVDEPLHLRAGLTGCL